MAYKELIIGFARAGVLGYGGGPSVIPLIKYEAVDNYKWMNDDEFGDVLAMANALPGPITTKMAAYIGFHVRGYMGAIVAILAHILPTVLAMIFLLSAIYQMKDSPVVQGMIASIGPVIAVMLAVMAYEFFEKAWKGLGWTGSIILVAIAFVLLEIVGFHPAIVIVSFVIVAIVQRVVRQRMKKNQVQDHTDTKTDSSGEINPPEKGGDQ